MKTLNVYRTYFPDPPGGLQEAIRQICLSTQKFDIQNEIFTLSKKPTPRLIQAPEATIYREKSWMAPASCDIGGIKAFMEFNRLSASADLIHLFHPWPFAELLNLVVNKSKPRLLTYISDVVRQKQLGKIYLPLMNKTLDNVDLIVANCPNYVKTSPVLSKTKFEHKIKVIPLGIDQASYPVIDNPIESLHRFHFDKTKPFFLFVGVLRYYKGLHTLLEAAKNTSQAIVIAGSGPEEARLKQMAAELQLSNVFFIGSITNEEKVALLKLCTALILPSHLRSEAYGMVLVEASMYGKPMISCEIGTGTSFVNLHHQTGFVVAPENPTQLSDAIHQLSDVSTSTTFGIQARQRYDELFSGIALGKAYSDAYRVLL